MTAAAAQPVARAKDWSVIEKKIIEKVEVLCKDRDAHSIATGIVLWASDDLVPEALPDTSGFLVEHLQFLALRELKGRKVLVYGDVAEVRLVPASTGLQNEFDITLTWNVAVPESLIKEMLQYLRLSQQQNALTADHLHSSAQKLLQFCTPGRSQ